MAANYSVHAESYATLLVISSSIKKLILVRAIFILTFLITLCISCEKDRIDDWETLKSLYNIYNNGEIDECEYLGEKVYVAGINAYDAGSVVYDRNGNIIGSCNYAWGQVDSICGQLQACEVIYRCDNHITGEPAIDKYGLGN